jgi:hypothetical protein
VASVIVLSAKDLVSCLLRPFRLENRSNYLLQEKACEQPVDIMTAAATMAALIPLKALAMFTAYTKFATLFDLDKVQVQVRDAQRIKNVLRH